MKTIRVLSWAAPVCAAALLFTACDREHNMGRPASATDRTTGQRVDDKQLSSQVKTALEANQAYKFPNVQVTTYEGKIQLSGFVATRDQKSAAEEIANRLAGSQNVENKITVQP